MPYFENMGPDKRNKSGRTSKGYHIYRHHTHVICRWGAILLSSMHGHIWAHPPRRVVRKFRSKRLAEEFKQQQISRLRTERYRGLSAGKRIRR
jgi:hypothetical protein